MGNTERLPAWSEPTVEEIPAGEGRAARRTAHQGATAGGLTATDRQISATARGVARLDPVLDDLARRVADRVPASLLDLGCAMGGLTGYVGRRLRVPELIGVDVDPERVAIAVQRGVRAHVADLNSDRLPLDDASVGLVTCFGVLAYLRLYDNVLGEAVRVLEPGGWFLLSMPNLASYTNRIRLLLGRQPEAVEVSQRGAVRAPQLHAATLRCMTELLTGSGFEVTTVTGFSPDSRRRRLGALDLLVRRLPSLSRRFVILARKR